ncbi:MAG: DUF4349 domain-containing protein [Pseudomonadota bacterium]
MALVLGALIAAGAATGCARASEHAPPSDQSPPLGVAAAALVGANEPVASKTGNATRKIIRQAELELEVASPSAAQTALERLAERHGGYVVSAARDTDNGSAVDVRVTLVVRVPQGELTTTISELKRMGRGTGSERITSDDVTDEYVDLVARATSQKQLEQQYLEILKHAATVKDAMDVQKELAEVRTEIERLQGRQQLLDKESAYSTLTVHLTMAVPQVTVSTTDFGATARRAWSESRALSVDLLDGGIRLVGLLIPLVLFVGLPGSFGLWLTVRFARALAARKRRQARVGVAA